VARLPGHFFKIQLNLSEVRMNSSDMLAPLVNAIADAVIERLEKSNPKARLLDVRSAAAYLGRSPHAIRHMIAAKALPSVRQDNRVFLDRQDLDAWIQIRKG
jgi:hypothetical protein